MKIIIITNCIPKSNCWASRWGYYSLLGAGDNFFDFRQVWSMCWSRALM